MSDKVPKKPKEAVERAKDAVERRETEIERVADKFDAVVQVEGPKAKERLAKATREHR